MGKIWFDLEKSSLEIQNQIYKTYIWFTIIKITRIITADEISELSRGGNPKHELRSRYPVLHKQIKVPIFELLALISKCSFEKHGDM